MRYCISYLPSWNILSELLVDDAADGHEVGIAGHLGSVVHPQVVLKILAAMMRKLSMNIYPQSRIHWLLNKKEGIRGSEISHLNSSSIIFLMANLKTGKKTIERVK